MVSRRGKWTLLAALATLPMVGFASGCTLWSDYSEGLTCSKDEDCFRAQGEVCDLMIKECVAGPQARLATPPVVTPETASTASVLESGELTDDVSVQAQQVQP
jgi:hypothetical protein